MTCNKEGGGAVDLPLAKGPARAGGTRSARQRARPAWGLIAMAALVAALWGGLLFGAYYLVTGYIDRSVRTVQETNALHVQALEERMETISAELAAVKGVLADTDQILSGTDSTQEALMQRIEALDHQLGKLEQSLDVLRRSPDVAP